MLKIRNVSKTYTPPSGPVTAVQDISLTIECGEFVAIRGPSGCGKSTLLLVTGGLLAPDTGEVLIGDENLYALSNDARAKFRAQNLGFVFQQFHLVPYLSVRDNVLTASLAAARSEAETRATDLIDRFGLAERAQHLPSELSTGEKQRTALARALLNGPKLLLADEPTGNLDAENAEKVLEDMRAFANDGGAVLLVTHDPKAVSFADHSIAIEAGKLLPAE